MKPQFTHQIQRADTLKQFKSVSEVHNVVGEFVGTKPFAFIVYENCIVITTENISKALLLTHNTRAILIFHLNMFEIKDLPVTEHTINDKVHELFVKFKERLLTGDFIQCDDNTIEFNEKVILKFIINNNHLAGITVQTEDGYRNDIFKSKHCEILYNLYSDAVAKKKNELHKKYEFMNNIKM